MVDTPMIKLQALRSAVADHTEWRKAHRYARAAAPRRLDVLRRALTEVRERHPEARSSVLAAIQTLEAELVPQRVHFAKAFEQTSSWRVPSVLNRVSAVLDPVLAELLPIDQLSGWETRNGDAILPLATHLQHHSECDALGKALRRFHADLDHDLEHGFVDESPTLMSLGEGLHALADVLEQVGKAWTDTENRQCGCCFRQASRNSKYCNEHRSGTTDTIYRQGQRIRGSLDTDPELRWIRRQAIRQAMTGPSLRLVSGGPAWTDGDGRHTETAAAIEALILATELRDWATVQPFWTTYIEQACPEVAKRFNSLLKRRHTAMQKQRSCELPDPKQEQLHQQLPSFGAFCGALHEALENRHEDTSTPVRILYLLDSAEAWFAAEQADQGRCNTDTIGRIQALHAQGVAAALIAQKLAVSRQYVYRILKNEISK